MTRPTTIGERRKWREQARTYVPIEGRFPETEWDREWREAWKEYMAAVDERAGETERLSRARARLVELQKDTPRR